MQWIAEYNGREGCGWVCYANLVRVLAAPQDAPLSGLGNGLGCNIAKLEDCQGFLDHVCVVHNHLAEEVNNIIEWPKCNPQSIQCKTTHFKLKQVKSGYLDTISTIPRLATVCWQMSSSKRCNDTKLYKSSVSERNTMRTGTRQNTILQKYGVLAGGRLHHHQQSAGKEVLWCLHSTLWRYQISYLLLLLTKEKEFNSWVHFAHGNVF